MSAIAAMADAVRANRMPVTADNPFLMAQQTASEWIVSGLETWTKARDDLQETLFLNIYGYRPLQAAIGLGTEEAAKRRNIERDLLREATAARAAAELERQIDQGGPMESAVRALLYVRMPGRSADERSFLAIKEIGSLLPAKDRVGLVRFKKIMREQFLILKLDQERAIAALPRLLPKDADERAMWLSALRRICTARGEPTEEIRRRLQQIEAIFAAEAPAEVRKPGRKKELQVEDTHGTGAKPAA
jgi:hypothetical protein